MAAALRAVTSRPAATAGRTGKLESQNVKEQWIPHTFRFFQDSGDHPDSEPDRGAEAIVRPLSANGPVAERARRRRLAGRFPVGVPHYRLPQRITTGVCGLRHWELGVQVRPPERAAPPAYDLQELRIDGDYGPVSSRRSAV